VVLSAAGAGLQWHYDAERLNGAYVYYGHPYWRSTWGGELLVSAGGFRPDALREDQARATKEDEMSEVRSDIGPDFGFDDSAEARRMNIGHGLYVSAKPNRIVFLTSNVEHCVAPVTSAAGDHVRAAVVGFFMPDSAAVSGG